MSESKEVKKTGWVDLDNENLLSNKGKQHIAYVRQEAQWIKDGIDPEHINNWQDLANVLVHYLNSIRLRQMSENSTFLSGNRSEQDVAHKFAYDIAYVLQSNPPNPPDSLREL